MTQKKNPAKSAMKKSASKALPQIPEFASVEEEAQFWDTHDSADYPHEFKPVQVKVAKSLDSGITVRFDPHTLSQLRSEAQMKGVGPTTLIRMWVLERLKADPVNVRRAE